MEIILLITIGLYLIALVSLLWMVKQYSVLEDDEDPVPFEDRPVIYEDYESEFYKPEI